MRRVLRYTLLFFCLSSSIWAAYTHKQHSTHHHKAHHKAKAHTHTVHTHKAQQAHAVHTEAHKAHKPHAMLASSTTYATPAASKTSVTETNATSTAPQTVKVTTTSTAPKVSTVHKTSLTRTLPSSHFTDAAKTEHWFVGASTGVTVPHVNTNTYGYAPTGSGWPNDQYVRGGTQTEPFLSVLGGYRWARMQEWLPFYSLSLEYTYVFNSKVSGKINQYSDPAFQNYTYQYEVQRQTVLALLKADIYRSSIQEWQWIMPYAVLGAGFSRNMVKEYSEQALPGVTPRVSPGFGAEASTYGSWSFGGGLDFILSEKVLASLEYNYGYYGYAATANGSSNASMPGNDYSNSSLKNQLNSSTFAAYISYFIR